MHLLYPLGHFVDQEARTIIEFCSIRRSFASSCSRGMITLCLCLLINLFNYFPFPFKGGGFSLRFFIVKISNGNVQWLKLTQKVALFHLWHFIKIMQFKKKQFLIYHLSLHFFLNEYNKCKDPTLDWCGVTQKRFTEPFPTLPCVVLMKPPPEPAISPHIEVSIACFWGLQRFQGRLFHYKVVKRLPCSAPD